MEIAQYKTQMPGPCLRPALLLHVHCSLTPLAFEKKHDDAFILFMNLSLKKLKLREVKKVFEDSEMIYY